MHVHPEAVFEDVSYALHGLARVDPRKVTGGVWSHCPVERYHTTGSWKLVCIDYGRTSCCKHAMVLAFDTMLRNLPFAQA